MKLPDTIHAQRREHATDSRGLPVGSCGRRRRSTARARGAIVGRSSPMARASASARRTTLNATAGCNYEPTRARQSREQRPAMVIEGYAALYGVETVIGNEFREVIASGAFREAVSRDDVRAEFNHDPTSYSAASLLEP
jgi:hypothetical protein